MEFDKWLSEAPNKGTFTPSIETNWKAGWIADQGGSVVSDNAKLFSGRASHSDVEIARFLSTAVTDPTNPLVIGQNINLMEIDRIAIETGRRIAWNRPEGTKS